MEKDWHAVRLVGTVAGVEYEDVRPDFAGGTSLSKAFGLIKRFSEDLDFRLALPEAVLSRPSRRRYRELVVEAIRAGAGWTLEDADIMVGNESRFFSCLVSYPANFALAPSLRPQLKLEMTFLPPALRAERRALRSFVAEARRDAPEVVEIACVAPAETAADKLSALTWRVLGRRRGNKRDDPTIIRHLHDLAALEQLATGHADFPRLLQQVFDQDVTRGPAPSGVAGMTPGGRFAAAMDMLAGDSEYREEYKRFVVAMSYAAEGETPAFEDALEAVRRLGSRLG